MFAVYNLTAATGPAVWQDLRIVQVAALWQADDHGRSGSGWLAHQGRLICYDALFFRNPTSLRGGWWW